MQLSLIIGYFHFDIEFHEQDGAYAFCDSTNEICFRVVQIDFFFF